VNTAIDTQTVTLIWQAYAGAVLVTRAVPVLADGATGRAARLGEIPGIRNPRIDTTRTVQLGDVPAPRYGWEESERNDIPMFPLPYAANAVRCPKCRQPGGMGCRSTGGGNAVAVATHRPRTERIAGWTNAVQEHAAMLVRAVGHNGYAREDLFAVFELAAAPIPAKTAKPPTPKGVRLSEKQAELIELSVQYDDGHPGIMYCPLGHLSGDHESRQTINALEAKGIVVEAEHNGSDRMMRLTPFGWQVYRQHRLIIRRLDAAEVDRREAEAAR